MAYRKEWYEKNKEKAYMASRRWALKNKKKLNLWYKEYRKKNKEKMNEIERRRYKKDRLKRLEAARTRATNRRLLIIKTYGGKCVCCGEDKIEFLSIDHVNGGGRKERKKMGVYTFYRSIIKRNFPKYYRILCHNCNQSLGFYKYCPHDKEFR